MTHSLAGAVSPHRGILTPPADASASGGKEVASHEYIERLRSTQAQLIAASREYQHKRVESRLQASPEDSHTYSVGDLVLIRPGADPSKLEPRWLGPYRVDKIDSVLHTCRNESTGHVVVTRPERMKAWVQRPDIDYLTVAASDKDYFVVERITAHKKMHPRDNQGRPTKKPPTWHFLTHWVGYPGQATWEPFRHVRLTEALQEYVQAHPRLLKEL